MESIDPQLISNIVTVGIFVASVLAGAQWQKGKNKLGQVRKLIDAVDDALYDDAVSEAEFRDIFERLNDLVHK